MSNLKTYGAVAIMIGCFIVVYPRFMHPIIMNISGMRESPSKGNDHETVFSPGHKGVPDDSGPQAKAEDVRRHMRPGPHPGMRAAAEMHRQQGQQSSGRGMMGVVLPMYAVGIVLYLGYTLYKVFNKTNNKNSNSSQQRYSWDKASRRQADRDSMGFPRQFDGSEDIANFLHDQQHRQNLEDLLTRVDDKNVSVDEMRVLQKRLEETEAQMTRILQAMQGVHSNVDNLKKTEMTGAKTDEQGNEEEEGVPKAANEMDGKSDKEATDSDATESPEVNPEAGSDQAEGRETDGHDEHIDAATKDTEEEEMVDELLEDRKDDDDDHGKSNKTESSGVRQRNVKSNEQ